MEEIKLCIIVVYISHLWNPYVLNKPAGYLFGHQSTIVQICVNNEDGIIFSLSEDKVIKLWNARNLTCLQTLFDKVSHRPENLLTAMFYDPNKRQIMTASSTLETWPVIELITLAISSK